MSQKPLLLSVATLALLVIMGAFWCMHKRQQTVAVAPVVTAPVQADQTSKPTEPIDTSDWKTYRNEEYGMEFRYPSQNFYLREYTDSAETVSISILKHGNVGIDVDKPGKIGILLDALVSEQYLKMKSTGFCSDIKFKSESAEICSQNKTDLKLIKNNYNAFVSSSSCNGDLGFLVFNYQYANEEDPRQHIVYALCDAENVQITKLLQEVLNSITFLKE